MKPNFDQNWTTTNGGVPLNDSEVERYIGVVPRPNQVHLAQQPFYCFMHFGMNTATQREWGRTLPLRRSSRSNGCAR